MLWQHWLSPTQLKELSHKGALQLGDSFKKFSPGKAGQWQTLNHTKYDLMGNGDYQVLLIGSGHCADEQGFYYLQSREGKGFTHNGRISYGSYLFSGDHIVIENEIFSFKKEKTQTSIAIPNSQMVTCNQLVLITGETGTGKGFLAKKIFELRKCQKNWVHLNLASLAPSLVESEIFGHVKGSFTGAVQDYQGALKAADHSVLFLDEIDSLSLDLQSKLLLFLDDYKFKSVGSQREQFVNVKLLVASGRALEDLVSKGLMRTDFYYRLMSGFKIRLSPLRENPILIKNFCLEFAFKNRIVIEPSLMEFYQKQKWPGNYRQLKAHLESKLALNVNGQFFFDEHDQQLITPFNMIYKKNDFETLPSLDLYKKSYAQFVYQRCHGDQNLAAKILSVNVKTLKTLL